MWITLLFHFVYSTGIAYVLSCFSGLNAVIAAFSILIGGLLAFFHARTLAREFPSEMQAPTSASRSHRLIERVFSAFVIVASLRHFAWMLYPADGRLRTLSPNNLGDLPLHINFIKAFANGISMPPINPIYSQDLLRYPFAVDFYSAMWEVLGVPLTAHLFVMGVLATGLALFMLRWFAGWWGIAAFFFSGGVGGWLYAKQKLFGLAWDLRNPDQISQWKNLFLALFITQRGMLVALPLGLFLLIVGPKLLVRSRKDLSRAQLRCLEGLGILWGLMPFFHLHAFLIVSILIFAKILIGEGWRAGAQKFFTSVSLHFALPLATFFILHSTNFFAKASVVHWRWGWTAPAGKLLPFLINNFAFWLPVPFAALATLWAARPAFSPELRRRYQFEIYVCLFFFVLFFNLMLAPSDWDNIKLLIWPFLCLTQVSGAVFEAALDRVSPQFRAWGQGALVLLLASSGMLVIYQSIQNPDRNSQPIYHVGELAYLEGALTDVPVDAVIASAPTYDHPLTYLGRLRTMGYDGHLFSHDIPYVSTLTLLNQLMRGEPEWCEAATRLRAQYILWSPIEIGLYGDDPKIWMSKLKNISRVEGWRLYKVTCSAGKSVVPPSE